MKLFQNKRLNILDSTNIFPLIIERNGNELLAQNKAAIKLFKQCPLTINNGRDIYFYYISNHLGEKISINEHKYIKYMKQIEEYLDNIKAGKICFTNKEIEKDECHSNKLSKSNEKIPIKENILNKRIIGIPLKKIKSTQIINSNFKDRKRKDKQCKKNINTFIEYKSNNKFIIKLNNSKETQKLLSKSKDTIIENKNNNLKKKINLIKDSSLYQFTPIKNTKYNITLKQNYSNKLSNGNKKQERINELKIDKKNNKIKCKSTKKLSFNLERNSLKEIDYSFHIKTYDTSNESNSMAKTKIKKNISSSPKLDYDYDYNNEFISRNKNKNKTMNLFKYIKNIKINDNNKDYMKFLRNKINYLPENNNIIKVKEEYEDIMNEHKRSSIFSLYEKTKNNKSFNKDNIEEINEYLKCKGLKNEDVLKSIQFNSEKAFINLRNQTNKLNIEAKTKAFFYGIIPNKRKIKIEQLNMINSKINQMEKEYIKTLIDKDLHFKNL